MQNPFKPTAGATPPDLIGRAGLLDEFEYGLRQGSGAPGLLTIITGARGIGKTVMLSAAEEIRQGSRLGGNLADGQSRVPSQDRRRHAPPARRVR